MLALTAVSTWVAARLGFRIVSALTPQQISAIDAAHIWHPYSTIGAEAMPPVVALGADGATG